MNFVERMKKLLYPEKKPNEIFFSFSGKVNYFDDKSVQNFKKVKKVYSNLDETFREFRKKLKDLGFEEYIPENSYIREIIPLEEDSSVSYQIDRYWFNSKDVELFYQIERKLCKKDGRFRCEELKLEGRISTTNRRKTKKVIKVLNSHFPSSVIRI